MISSPRNSVTHNQQAKLAVDYNELLKELSSHEMTSVGCYTIGETIGEGTFGKVKKGTHKLTGRMVAIKKISKQHAPMMAREIHHQRQLRHPNVVMLYEMITTESCIHIISEYCPNGDLLDALTDSGRCSEPRVKRWFHQLTDAIRYCHMRGIVHRDLKLENILLDEDDNVKICDFGFARYTQKNQYLDTFCGSLSYSAPEVILRKKYTGPETDIWSLGVILYTLLAGEYPFDDDSEVMTQRKIVQVDYQMPYYFSSDLADLIQHMLQANPSDRLSIDAMAEHAWLSQCDLPSLSDADSLFSQSDSTLDDLEAVITPDLKFSPQVRSSLGILRPSQQQQQNKSPRFSAPTLNRRAVTPTSPLQSSFRTSLPSSFYYQRESSINSETHTMTPIEQRLFAALTAAGFDRDALIKMQTGECDTSSTLWHLLLENMSHAQPSKSASSVSDAFASAIHLHHQNPIATSTTKGVSVDVGIQTGDDSDSNVCSMQEAPKEPEYVKPYPSPVIPHPIQTMGFGSTANVPINDKSGWFSSVKSWFGSKQQMQLQQQQQQQQQQQRSRSSSNCSTITSPIASPSSYRNFDAKASIEQLDSTVAEVMSPPIYRNGSQKYRRRALQLSEPPVSELDQLTYNTTLTRQQHTNDNTTTTTTTTTTNANTPTHTSYSFYPTPYHYHHFQSPSKPDLPAVHMPPTALTSHSRHITDTFSILTSASSQPKEVDMCEKRYSLMYNRHQPTPPSSPPGLHTSKKSTEVERPPSEEIAIQNMLLSPMSPMEEHSVLSLPSLPEDGSKADIKNDTLLSDFSSDDSSSSSSDTEEAVIAVEEPKPSLRSTSPEAPTPQSTDIPSNSMFGHSRARSSRFEFTPRSRLSMYNMQDQRPAMGAKTIIEEEEEEE